MPKSPSQGGRKMRGKDSAGFAARKQTTLPNYFSIADRSKKSEPDSGSSGGRNTAPHTPVTLPPSDPSTWRESTLPDYRKVSKGDAHSQYRLGTPDFNDLEVMHYQTKEGHISHLYNEQAIERKAWEKHGGPKGWAAYLETLRGQYLKKYGSTAVFPEPKLPADKKKCIDQEFPRQEANLKANLPPWLWNQLQDFFRSSSLYRKLSINDQISVPGCDSRAEQLNMIQAPIEHKLLDEFPARKDEEFPMPDSVSFNALQELLAIAPIVENEINEAGIVSKQLVKTHWDNRMLYDWTEEFKISVKTAVDRITQEHTSRSNELHAQAMWIVYDKYARCLWPFGMCFVGNTTRTTEGEELGHWEIKAIQVFQNLEAWTIYPKH